MHRGFLRGTLFRTLLMACLAAALAVPAVAHAVLSGTNGRILFASGRASANGDDSQAKLYLRTTIGSTGGGATGPTLTPQAGQHRHPTWSPDRTMIAYARGGSGCNPDCDIFILDLTDPNATPENITKTDNVNEDRPAWSPDGTRIAYESEVVNNSGQTDVLVEEEPFGGLAGNLTNTSAANAFEGKPAWTPDSDTIYYAKGNPSGNANIMKRPADGGAETVGVPDSGITEFQPSVSPDGSQVCFTLSNGGFNATASILVAQVANPASQIVVSSSGQGDYNCTWSPDGLFVAYVTGVFTNGALVFERADNTGFPLTLEDDAGNFDGNPDWAPDGRPRCEDLEVIARVNTPVSIPIPCEDTGPNYERTQVRASFPTDQGPQNGTIPTDVVTLPASVTYTPNAGFTGNDSFVVRSFDEFAFGNRNGTLTIRVQEEGQPGVNNDFSFGKVKKNKKKGTAKLTVNVPNPGDLELRKSKKLKGDEETADAEGREKLKVRPKGNTKEKLSDTGEAKVRARVTYTPVGGDPNTKSKKINLKLRG
jgi:Tol biopolymer transport system component